MPLLKIMREFLSDTDGVTAIEYAMIAGIMVLAIYGGVFLIGGNVSATFNHVNNGF